MTDTVTPAPIAEHYETSGWTGPAGQCGVKCACGTTFDGFDTLGEAGDHLSRHIAASTVPDTVGQHDIMTSQITQAEPATDPYRVTADYLHQLADQLATLAGRGLTDPHLTIGILPYGPYGSDETSEATRVAVVDAVAEALGMVPKVRPMSSGSHHYNAERNWQHGQTTVYTNVLSDEVRELRRRLAEAEAELAERHKTRPPLTATVAAPAGLELEQAAIPAEAMTRLVQPEPIHDPEGESL